MLQLKMMMRLVSSLPKEFVREQLPLEQLIIILNSRWVSPSGVMMVELMKLMVSGREKHSHSLSGIIHRRPIMRPLLNL